MSGRREHCNRARTGLSQYRFNDTWVLLVVKLPSQA